MLFSLKDFVTKLSPPSTPMQEGIHVVKTNSFTLHHFQTLSNMTFVINTDPNVPGIYLKLIFYVLISNILI